MKTGRLKTGVIAIALLSAACEAKAQDKVEASAGADLVSGYIWRGQDLGGVSIQPGLTLSYKGFSVSAWGSVGLESSDTKKMDLTLGYTVGGFSISVTDYWFNGGKGYLHYDAHDTSHVFEAQIGYDFGPVAVNWYTNFAGADYMKYDGSRAYSSYISVAAPFKLGGLDWAENRCHPMGNKFLQCDRQLSGIRRFHRMRYQPVSKQGDPYNRQFLTPIVCQSHLEPTHRRGLLCSWNKFLKQS